MPRLIFFTLMLVLMTSCGTTARMIEIGSDEDLTTISSIDPRDWQKAAADSISAMLESGALKRADGRKNVVMISRIRNYTLQHLDSRLLTAKMRQAILASGQAIVTSAIGNSSNIDLAVRRIRDKEYDDLFDQSTGSETRHRHRAGFEPVRVNHSADDGSGAHGGELFRVSSCPDGLENGSCALGEQCGNRETGERIRFLN